MRHIRLLQACLLVLAVGGVSGCGGSDAEPPPPADPRPDTQEPRPDTVGSPASLRMVVLGTSLTAGMGLADAPRESWVGQIQHLADSAGYPVEVVNAGVSGDTSAGGLRRLDWLLRTPLDVLVVELGANDGLRGQSPDALADNLRAIVTRTRATYPRARVILAEMEAPTNMGPAYTQAFRDVFTRVSREEGVPLIPFLLDGVAGDPSLNQADGIHPTPEGHERMARNAWPVIEDVLDDLHPGGGR